MLMDLVFVLKWVKSVSIWGLYIFHLSDVDVDPIAAVGQKYGALWLTWVTDLPDNFPMQQKAL